MLELDRGVKVLINLLPDEIVSNRRINERSKRDQW